MLKLTGNPSYRTVGVNETVMYQVESNDSQFPLDETDVFLWGVAEVTDFRNIGNGIAVGGKCDSPVRGTYQHEYSFAREGRYQIIAVLQPKAIEFRPGANKELYYGQEYFQNVAPTGSFMWDPVNNERTHAQDPAAATAAVARYYNLLVAAGAPLALDLSSMGRSLRDRHLKQVKEYEQYAESLADRLSSTQDWVRIPLTATLTPNGSGDTSELNVFLAHPKNDGIVRHWKVVDWTHPGDLALDREYDGKGLTDSDAIKDAFREWSLENQYPAGTLSIKIPRNVLFDVGATATYTTSGRSWLGTIADFTERAGIFLTLIAVILAVAPIPGSSLAAVALVGVFAGALSITGAALNMYDRGAHGVSNASADALDMLTMAGALLGVAGLWARGATLAIRSATGIRSMVLMGEVTLDSIQGVMVAVESVGEIDDTLNNKSLTPDEKFKRLLKTGAALVIKAALIYVNVRGTLKDMARINTPKPPSPKKPPATSNGEKLNGAPEENLKKLKDPEKKIDLTDDPTVTGNTKEETHTTTIHSDPPRTVAVKSDLEGHFPANEKFWYERTITDTEIRLRHRFHEAPNDRTADLKFNAHISSEGVMHVDVIKTMNWRVKATGELVTNASEGSRLQSQGLAEPVRSEYFEFGQSLDGAPALVPDELYAMMFDHFESAASRGGVQIKGIDGDFAWSNYRAWKAGVAAGKDPAAAILESSLTGPKWKRELDARGYEYKMAPGFPKDNPGWEQVEWELLVKKK